MSSLSASNCSGQTMCKRRYELLIVQKVKPYTAVSLLLMSEGLDTRRMNYNFIAEIFMKYRHFYCSWNWISPSHAVKILNLFFTCWKIDVVFFTVIYNFSAPRITNENYKASDFSTLRNRLYDNLEDEVLSDSRNWTFYQTLLPVKFIK